MTKGRELTRRLIELADESLAALGRYEATIAVAGHPIRLIFAGRSLHDQMMPALQHITVQDVESELDVRIWDQVRSQVAIPRSLWTLLSSSSADTTGDCEPLTMAWAVDGNSLSLDVWDDVASEGFCVIHDADDLQEWDLAAPLRNVLNWALQPRGLSGVHAAAVGTEDGGLLLSGMSGAGKSTTSLACVEQGFDFVADDFCLVQSTQAVTAFSLFCTGKAFDHQLYNLPAFDSVVANRERLSMEKALGYLTDSRRFRLRTELPIRAAVLLAAKGGSEPTIERISSSKALLGFGPSTLLTFRGLRQNHLSSLRELVSRVPCFEMHLSSDVRENPRALRLLLEELTGEASSE